MTGIYLNTHTPHDVNKVDKNVLEYLSFTQTVERWKWIASHDSNYQYLYKTGGTPLPWSDMRKIANGENIESVIANSSIFQAPPTERMEESDNNAEEDDGDDGDDDDDDYEDEEEEEEDDYEDEDQYEDDDNDDDEEYEPSISPELTTKSRTSRKTRKCRKTRKRIEPMDSDSL